jgi:hypothetical protein
MRQMHHSQFQDHLDRMALQIEQTENQLPDRRLVLLLKGVQPIHSYNQEEMFKVIRNEKRNNRKHL